MLPQVIQIAERVKALREILEITEEAVASGIAVSIEEYRDYENAVVDIPIGKLYSIANLFGVDPTVLLIGDAPRMVDYTIVRGGRGVDVERHAGYKFSSLAYNFVNREMEPMIVTLEPGGDKPSLITHGGQEFNYVLEGTVAVIFDDKEHILEVGDSIYFNPEIPHGQRAVGDKTARFLTVINE